tara:strand:- start:9273 stop:9434 length:162 start_codon:yes stop_codon:yes gene_type:complete
MSIKSNPEKWHKLVLRLPKETYLHLREMADEQVSSITYLINKMIREHLKNQDN